MNRIKGWSRVALIITSILATWLFFDRRSRRVAHPLDKEYGKVARIDHQSRFAIATYLTAGLALDPADKSDDAYFAATRLLAYQILHDPQTRVNNSRIDFVVAVSAKVQKYKCEQLERLGAKVIVIEEVPLSWWVRPNTNRWKDQFNKLRLLQMVQYARVLCLDADMLLTSSRGPIFTELETVNPINTLSGPEHVLTPTRRGRADEAPLPAQYLFAARSDNGFAGGREHPFPPLQTANFNAGFWVAAPCPELYTYLLSIMKHYRRFDPNWMEQGMLNYAFKREGPMPWRELHYRWATTWASHKDFENGVVALHEKFWKGGPDEMVELWKKKHKEMQAYEEKIADGE